MFAETDHNAFDGASHLTPGSSAYDEARTVWNSMIDRRPSAVFQCRNRNDVAAAVQTAAAGNQAVSIRGGGHNIAGLAVSDGALMVDLRSMNGISIDPDRRTAQVEGGATWADFDAAAQAHGLATPGGVVSSTGVGGLTLGGGFGWLARLHGLAADNLLEVELVLADGSLVVASDETHADLFWALRGGGGNFGVATKFTFRLHQVGPDVLFGPTFFSLDDAGDVLNAYAALADALPREACVWANLMTAPPVPVLPEAVHGTKVLVLMQSHVGDVETGRNALLPLHAGRKPLGDALMPRPFVEAQQFLDPTYPFGARNYWSSANHDRLSPGLIDTLLDLAPDLPTTESELLICQLGGAIQDTAPDATAFPHRDIPFLSTPGVRWHDPAKDEEAVGWLKDAALRIKAHAVEGRYVNFIAESDGPAKDAYGSNLARLADVKRHYDPDNRFRVNQNVRPRDLVQ